MPAPLPLLLFALLAGPPAEPPPNGARGETSAADEAERKFPWRESLTLGLEALAAEQDMDGGWSFTHPARDGDPPRGSRHEATALALLPFLEAGQTPSEGAYRETVRRGLARLRQAGLVDREAATRDLRGEAGSLRSHALATRALCLAYGRTGRKELLEPAQQAVAYLEASQHEDGGWGWQPGEPGDMRVTALACEALKEAHTAYLSVRARGIVRLAAFCDAVASEEGSRYGFTADRKNAAATAHGLHVRYLLGWKHTLPAAQRGIEYLLELEPAEDPQGNYHAACAIFALGAAEQWERRRAALREHLPRTQQREGPARGGWTAPGLAGPPRTCVLRTSWNLLTLQAAQRAQADLPRDHDDFPL